MLLIQLSYWKNLHALLSVVLKLHIHALMHRNKGNKAKRNRSLPSDTTISHTVPLYMCFHVCMQLWNQTQCKNWRYTFFIGLLGAMNFPLMSWHTWQTAPFAALCVPSKQCKSTVWDVWSSDCLQKGHVHVILTQGELFMRIWPDYLKHQFYWRDIPGTGVSIVLTAPNENFDNSLDPLVTITPKLHSN